MANAPSVPFRPAQGLLRTPLPLLRDEEFRTQFYYCVRIQLTVLKSWQFYCGCRRVAQRNGTPRLLVSVQGQMVASRDYWWCLGLVRVTGEFVSMHGMGHQRTGNGQDVPMEMVGGENSVGQSDFYRKHDM